MTPAWDTVRDTFGRLIELPPPDRERELSALPAEIRAEVAALLAADRDAGAFLRPQDQRSHDASGSSLGPYKLLRSLGSGGMGIVYLAHRGDGEFRREVAIKIAGGRLFAPEAERRFIHERQILAQLDHPNIVRLLDGGIADSQRYFVMEYIAGQPLLEYARAKNLSDCLRLFLDICSAVHYAHQRLIIHRDLKAANILVNAEGVVKLLDFGIAQIVEPGGGSSGATFLRPVSLACMSPEQVRGESLTLATDIYSLGVLLYELTAGINPQFRDGDSYAEAVERVLQADPPPPGHYNRGLPRDLDAVVLKAIAKDPRDRYSSVAELRADVERFLAGRPVLALPPSLLYQARKFVRRNRAFTLTAATLLVSLIAAAIAITRQERLEAERFDFARRFVRSVIFEMQPGLEAIPGALPLRQKMLEESMTYLEALSKGAGENVGLLRELSASYAQLADVQGNMQVPNLGRRQLALNLMAQAEALLLRALALAPRDPGLQREAARLYSNLTLFDVQGLDLRKADEHSRKALDYLGKVAADPESRPLRPHVLYARGLAIDRLDPAAGIALFEEASALYSALHREKPGDELHQGMMLCHWRLAARHLVELRPQQALRHSRQGLVLADQSLAASPASPRRQLAVSTAAGILCWNYIDLRDYASAEPLARRLTAMRERILQEDPGNQQSLAYLAEAFKYLASSRLGLGQFQGTRDAAAQAVRIYEEMLAKGTLAPFHRAGLPESRLILADALLSAGNLAEGCAERRRGLAAFHAIGVDQRLKGFRRSIQDAQKAVDECEAAMARPVNPTARKSEDTAPPAQTPQTRP